MHGHNDSVGMVGMQEDVVAALDSIKLPAAAL